MQIHYTREGGFAHFPGLSKPTLIDSDSLALEEVHELHQLIHTMGFFDLPEVASAPAVGAADYYTYTITIDDGTRSHTVECSEPFDDPHLENLLHILEQKAKAIRAAQRAKQ